MTAEKLSAPAGSGREHDGHERDDDRVHDFLRANEDRLVAQLAEWVRIPSVAGSNRDPDLRRSAAWLAGALRDTGFPRVEIWWAGEAPAVFAEWAVDRDAPTVLVYSHHDVRAVKEENWSETAPFEPVVRAGRLYGRGSSDAKGQILAHLWGLRAHLAEHGAPLVNLKFLVEGEEELGSPSFAGLLEEKAEEIAADLVVFSDTLLWRAGAPAICTSVRGMISAHIEVYGPVKDIHSGAASGSAPNSALELSRLLASVLDSSGRIALPGFYDDARPIPDERREELAALPFDEEDWLARSHTRKVGGESGYTVLEQLWLRPSVEVISMIAGDPVGPTRAAIPAVAAADISFRTVPGQRNDRVAEQIRRWAEERLPDTVEATVEVAEESAQLAYETPRGPAVDALDAAMRRGFRVSTVGRMGNAGGGPAELMARMLKAPIVFFGTGYIEDDWHDSDESVHLPTLLDGAATLAFLWEELARALPD
ncbi:MAG: Peptidase [Naasia sp.]|jgi:acetylornithine deacetylase/succinyl-diaminopimelate desuccinylase-like protein|uniref:M20/M25/M40 family metallo-hydrolase n=1 Tax=Naasia sp. TaxID=2546198 RepID=UPI00260A77F5|nr:M20/M25/M40 family metallo-hydrolase [Naasia sp.]MCU1569914.1 Peptidase [Naasia sp.]